MGRTIYKSTLTAETEVEMAVFSTGTSHELHTRMSHTHMSYELIALTAGDRSRVGSVFYRYESRNSIHTSQMSYTHESRTEHTHSRDMSRIGP